MVADLTRCDEVERLADAVGEIDVLAANAGIPASGELVSFSVDQIDRAIDVNVRSAMILANLLVPRMLARKSGHVVLIAFPAQQNAGGAGISASSFRWE